ncbi:reverse transcriptase domain-containing protein [Olivibacter domesticus]|uniref:RNA-directed DNA polymerase n=1 Tax=Olivibacter domesticus TaxID=407022 RepID=A0A1H7JP65_OLID1|nr:reverse transcriptase domain-containing protein [Olivibacter domesticus]SEK76106.1 RNA-directed DNA polymerase [Olivibacter domesticus]
MNFAQYEKKFRLKALKSGFSEDNIVACLNYAKPILEKGLPVIYNTANLAALVGYRTTYLKRAAKFTKFYYRSFTIKKSNGKLRTLMEPLPSLKEIQTWILENMLSEIPVSKFAKAYVKHRSLKENVKHHNNKEGVLTCDIATFYDSVRFKDIEKIFNELGYSEVMSNLLAKLTTFNGSLPQGAPTSPYLSNLVLREFDQKISDYCINNNIRYTRYADDLTFSGEVKSLKLKNLVEAELNKLGLELNPDKTKLRKFSQRQMVTGIVVNEKTQIPKFERNFIRNEVHFLTRFGLKDHLRKTKNKRENYLLHLLGKINFALHINPADKKMESYRSQVQKIIQTDAG